MQSPAEFDLKRSGWALRWAEVTGFKSTTADKIYIDELRLDSRPTGPPFDDGGQRDIELFLSSVPAHMNEKDLEGFLQTFGETSEVNSPVVQLTGQRTFQKRAYFQNR